MTERYRSQINIPEINSAGQKQIETSKILVIGAGGLGCPSLLSLAGLGIGSIGIADFDIISLSNLNRQTLYTEDDVGKLKSEVAAVKLRERNSSIEIISFNQKLGEENAKEIISRFDMVLDCCDNYETRYVIDSACAELGKPWIYAAVGGFEGQLSVFNYKKQFRYKDLYQNENIFSQVSSCEEQGITVATCAFASALQIAEMIKLVLELPDVNEGKLLAFNLLNGRLQKFELTSS